MKHAKKTIIATLLVLAAIIILPTGIENSFVKSQLDKRFAGFLSKASSLSLAYDTVAVKGFYPFKRVEIERLRVGTQTATGQVIYSFDTVQAKMANPFFTHWIIEAPAPIGITQNLKKIGNVTFNEPVTGDVTLAAIGSKNIEISITFPIISSVVQELMPQNPAVIRFSQKPLFAMKTDSEGKPEYIRISAKDLVAQGPIADDKYTCDEVNFIYQKSTPPNQKTMQDVEVVLKNLAVPYYVHPYGAGTFILRTSLIGDFAPTPDVAMQVFLKEGDLEILEASYNVKDFGINLKGSMKTKLADVPVGKGQLVVRNVPFVLNEIIENNMLTGDHRALLYSIISQMTGDSVSNLKDANIALERNDGSELTIGGISLSKLTNAIAKNDVNELK